VIEADILRVRLEDRAQCIRLMDVDAEPSRPRGAKAATALGRQALEWARRHFADAAQIELESPEDDAWLSNSGKSLWYVHVNGENYNCRLVREGWSPVFEKYGHPLIHRPEMERSEQWARLEGRGVWGGLGGRGDYQALKSYWQLRAGQVEGFRHARAMGEDVLDCRLHYADVAARARSGMAGCVFGDLARLYEMGDGSVLIRVGSPQRSFVAYFAEPRRELAHFLEREYMGFGKPNYVYLSGPLSMAGDHPQIVIERLEQISLRPPKTTD